MQFENIKFFYARKYQHLGSTVVPTQGQLGAKWGQLRAIMGLGAAGWHHCASKMTTFPTRNTVFLGCIDFVRLRLATW